jgi:hypothetical protein
MLLVTHGGHPMRSICLARQWAAACQSSLWKSHASGMLLRPVVPYKHTGGRTSHGR